MKKIQSAASARTDTQFGDVNNTGNAGSAGTASGSASLSAESLLDAELHYDNIRLRNRRRTWNYTLPFDETLLVPDTMPDMIQILFSEGRVTPSQPGKTHYSSGDTYSGEILLFTVYRPDGGEGLNVCLMNDSFPPVVDGVANAVVNYAKILTETEGLCAVATPEYPGVVDDYPFPVVRYPSIDTTKMTGYRAGNPFAPAAVAELAAMDFDIIHTHCPIVSTLLARSLREAIDKPVVFTYHTKFDIDIAKAVRGKTLQEAAVKLLVSNISACDEVWVVSRGAGENLRSLGYAGDYIVMPNGVDLPRGKASPEAVDALSRKWALPADKPVYLFIGRIMWYKGLRIILDGLKKVRDAGGDFCMVFVGDGQDRPAVEEYAAQLGLTDLCRFTGTERDRDTIRAWYTRADLLLFPSTFDTNGLVVREAAACSLGSVLIEGSCAAEGITDGDTGILIPENGDGLAAALLREGADRAYFARIGETASEKIYLSWEDSVKNARAQYRSVIERWNNGELPRRRVLPGAPEWTGDVAELINRARTGWDKAREALDRYL